jgi:hypothetical protein
MELECANCPNALIGPASPGGNGFARGARAKPFNSS